MPDISSLQGTGLDEGRSALEKKKKNGVERGNQEEAKTKPITLSFELWSLLDQDYGEFTVKCGW